MKILFIGGTGVISSACSALAVKEGHELYLLNRGRSARIIDGARLITADVRDEGSFRDALGNMDFDAVVNWIAFTPEHIQTDLTLFKNRTAQYIFISSASAYEKPVRTLPITENTPLSNPFWQYARSKISCEEELVLAHRSTGFPVTIVRPSFTYDKTIIPLRGGATAVRRMLDKKPVWIPGDGTSLWVMTHHKDFARGFNGLLGLPEAIGEAFHITSDEVLTWNRIYGITADAFGIPSPEFVHVPSDVVARFDEEAGANLLGDKSHSVFFDNSKIRKFVPAFRADISFETGMRETAAWYRRHPELLTARPEADRLAESVITAVRPA